MLSVHETTTFTSLPVKRGAGTQLRRVVSRGRLGFWWFSVAFRNMALIGRAPLMQNLLRGSLRVLSSRGMATGRPAPQEPPFPWRCDMLAGKAAIVTGGSAGIGASITEALVRGS